MTAAGEWMCLDCARTVAGCKTYGCIQAGRTPPSPVWVDAAALDEHRERLRADERGD